MGQDKAGLLVDGEPLAQRTCRLLSGVCTSLLVLGPDPVGTYPFLPDVCPGAGPLAAIAHLKPDQDLVMLVSCDLPRFDPALVNVFQDHLGALDAVIPVIEGRLQPLCGLYRAVTFEVAAQLFRDGNRSVMPWLTHIEVREIDAEAIAAAGLDPRSVMGVNTPEEFAAIMGER